jgi:hypothetical protein
MYVHMYILLVAIGGTGGGLRPERELSRTFHDGNNLLLVERLDSPC